MMRSYSRRNPPAISAKKPPFIQKNSVFRVCHVIVRERNDVETYFLFYWSSHSLIMSATYWRHNPPAIFRQKTAVHALYMLELRFFFRREVPAQRCKFNKKSAQSACYFPPQFHITLANVFRNDVKSTFHEILTLIFWISDSPKFFGVLW